MSVLINESKRKRPPKLQTITQSLSNKGKKPARKEPLLQDIKEIRSTIAHEPDLLLALALDPMISLA